MPENTVVGHSIIYTDLPKYEEVYVYGGLWRKDQNGEYTFISKQRMNAPCVFFIKVDNILKGEFILIYKCTCDNEIANKLIVSCDCQIKVIKILPSIENDTLVA